MSSENVPAEGVTRQATRQGAARKPVVNGRPIAVLAGNATVIAGSTLVAAGGLPALAAGTAAVALTGAAAAAGKKVAGRRGATRVARTAARANGTRSGVGAAGGRSRKAGAAGAGTRSGRLASAARSLARKAGLRSAGTGASGRSGASRSGAGTGVRSAGRSVLPGIFRRSGSGSSPGRSGSGKSSGIARTLGAPFRAARATGKALGPAARKVAAGAKRTGSGIRMLFRWLVGAWQKITGRSVKKAAGSGKTPGKVNDPHRKATGPKMATGAPVPPPPPRPTLTARLDPPKLPHAERIAHMSTAAIRMQELADEMLAVSRQYAYAMDEKGSGVGLLSYASDCHAIPGILQTVAEAVRTRHQMAESLPISSVIPEAQQEVHSLQMSVAVAAEAAWGLLEAVEAEKLSTLRNPHPNQHKAETAENAEV